MRPTRRWRALVAAVALLALGFATLAHAAHLHKPGDTKGGTHQEICALCLQFERLGTPPSAVLLPAVLLVALVLLPAATRPLPLRPAPLAYRSRAPPSDSVS